MALKGAMMLNPDAYHRSPFGKGGLRGIFYKIISLNLDFNKLEPFKVDCPVAGIYLFLPYITELGIIDIVKKCGLPGSSVIGPVVACLSMLMLKLTEGE